MSKYYRRIKSQSPIDAIIPFIMPNRNGASNKFYATVDIEKCEQLIKKKKAEGMTGLSMMHLLMAAYIRVVSEYPGINRFISGQRLYARKNIEISLTIKKELKLNAPESLVKLITDPSATLDSVYKDVNEQVVLGRKEDEQNGTDLAAKVLICFPGIFLKFVVWILKMLDYFMLLPRFLTKVSPFHGSMFITNMGSLGMPPIYHHLYDFGNVPMFIAMGKKRTRVTFTKDGTQQNQRVIDFTIVCDERICDGHYYATAFKKLKKILENPEQLLMPPQKITEDIA